MPDTLGSLPWLELKMKKKLLALLSLAFAGLLFGYLFLVSWLPSFLMCKYLSADREGEPSRIRSIIIPVGKWKMHFHHWLCSLGLAGVSSTTGYYFVNPAITYGMLGGLVFQGIYCYSDWNRIVFRRGQRRAKHH